MPPSLAPIRILLADDHAVVRAGIRQFLEQASDLQVVAEAEDGAQAQALINEHRPAVAVLDIQMPKASGIEVTRWVKATVPEVGVLVLTAYDDEPYVRAVIQAGANGFVLKTATPAAIIQAVRDVYAGKAVLDSVLAHRVLAHLHAPANPYEPLSDRELAVLALAAQGHTNKAIGVALNISDRTVQGHLAHIFAKLQTASRTEAVMRAVTLGLITPGAPPHG